MVPCKAPPRAALLRTNQYLHPRGRCRAPRLGNSWEGGFTAGPPDLNRSIELDFWRRASNCPSCEPIGLAVALRKARPEAPGTSPIEVSLDADGPVLLEAHHGKSDEKPALMKQVVARARDNSGGGLPHLRVST